jgi:RimJ/RimL family protein N-acetyltransferase
MGHATSTGASRSPDQLTVRPATLADRDGYRASFEEVAGEACWIGSELPVDWEARPPWEEVLASPDVLVLVAADGSRIVGGLFMQRDARWGWTQLGMHLVDGYRSLGLGSRLLEAAIAWSRQVGAHKVLLDTFPHNTRAIGLYEKHGFVVEGHHRRHWRRNDGSLWDSVSMGLVLDDDAPGHPYWSALPAE